jgi:hypothetical protein
MRRDWPLAGAGMGIAAISATFVAIMLLGYRLQPDPCDPPQPGRGVMVDGCFVDGPTFGEWVQRPWTIGGFAFALVLLLVAGVTIRRGLRQRTRT